LFQHDSAQGLNEIHLSSVTQLASQAGRHTMLNLVHRTQKARSVQKLRSNLIGLAAADSEFMSQYCQEQRSLTPFQR